MSVIKTVFGLDLPTSGKVVGKAVDPAREIDYSGGNPNSIVGKRTINRDPIYWLEVKDGRKKPRWIQVSREIYDTAVIGQQWTATPQSPKAA